MTFIFNTFVIFQLVNEFNSRFLDNTLNIFKGLHKNYMFILIWFLTLAVQAIMVEFGGFAIGCHLDGLTGIQ